MEDKKGLIQIIISSVIVITLLALAYFIVVYEPPLKMMEIDNIDINSDILSTNPSETAYKFIKANGTMGNVEKDITQETMKTNEAIFENAHRRQIALSKVKDAIIPGSPLIDGKEEGHIKIFASDLDAPYIYEISNMRVSEPSKLERLTVYSEVGPTEYDSTEVFVSFDSTRITYNSAKDTSYDGTHVQISNTENYEEIKVTLVQIGELWFVYDVENAENLINERFATWSGIHPSNIDYSKNIETGEFKVEGIEPVQKEDIDG